MQPINEENHPVAQSVPVRGFSWRHDITTKMEALRDNLCVSFTELQILPDNQPSEGHKQT